MKRLVGDPNDPRLKIDASALAGVAASLGVTVVAADAFNPAGFEAGVASLVGQRVEAIMAVGSLATNLRDGCESLRSSSVSRSSV